MITAYANEEYADNLYIQSVSKVADHVHIFKTYKRFSANKSLTQSLAPELNDHLKSVN